MALTIISLIKQVPLPTEMRMGDDGLMDRTKAKSIINIDCQFGLEAGLQLKKQYPDARLIACSMGPGSFETALRTAISMGYDEAYLLSDRKLGGSDTYATGLAISTMLMHLGFSKDSKEPFIIFAGRQTSDGDTAHVPSQVAEHIGIPQATFVESVKAQRLVFCFDFRHVLFDLSLLRFRIEDVAKQRLFPQQIPVSLFQTAVHCEGHGGRDDK